MFHATSLSLFRVFRHSCLGFSFSFFSSAVFLLFTVFSRVTKSQLSDLPPGVHRVHWLSGITWVGLSCIQLVCAFLQPLNHYCKDQKKLDQLKQKNPTSFEIFTLFLLEVRFRMGQLVGAAQNPSLPISDLWPMLTLNGSQI